MHERLREVAPQLALVHVVLLGVQARRAAGRAVALEPVRGHGPVPADVGHLGHPEPAEHEGALGLVQRPRIVAEPVHVPVLGEFLLHRVDAGRKLVETAQRANAQLIVLAGRGSASMLLGTVSQYVLRRAPCPVLVVPESSRDAWT